MQFYIPNLRPKGGNKGRNRQSALAPHWLGLSGAARFFSWIFANTPEEGGTKPILQNCILRLREAESPHVRSLMLVGAARIPAHGDSIPKATLISGHQSMLSNLWMNEYVCNIICYTNSRGEGWMICVHSFPLWDIYNYMTKWCHRK